MNSPIFSFVLDELQARKGQWPDICRETGIDYSWLTKLVQGKISNPGLRHMEPLYIYLQGRKKLAENMASSKAA